MPHGPYTYPLQTNPDLSREQQQVFGVDAVRHPITGMVLEQGSGSAATGPTGAIDPPSGHTRHQRAGSCSRNARKAKGKDAAMLAILNRRGSRSPSGSGK